MGKKDGNGGKSGDGVVVTTVQKGTAGAKAVGGAVKTTGQYAAAPIKGATKKRKKGSDSSSEEGVCNEEIAPDCFRMVSPVYLLLMFLVISLLGLCALDPDDCELIPGVGGFMRTHAGWVGLLFYGVVVMNMVLSVVAVKHCLDFHLTKKTTSKWFGQTLLAGYPSLKLLKELEIEVRTIHPNADHGAPPPSKEGKKK